VSLAALRIVAALMASSSSHRPMTALPRRAALTPLRGGGQLFAQCPVQALLAQQEDAPLGLLRRRPHEQSRSLEDFEFRVHGTDARRVAELGCEVLDAHHAVAGGDRGADFQPVLSAAEQCPRQLTNLRNSLHIRSRQYVLKTMDQRALRQMLRDMIAAGGVRCLPARTPWPMHRALRLLYEHAGRTGELRLLPPAPCFDPCSEVGLAAQGADAAFYDLVREGLLREAGAGLEATLITDTTALVRARRALLARDPAAVALLQRAGERWAAFASTAAKTAAMPAASSASRVVSLTA
jgi:hypothetical protein